MRKLGAVLVAGALALSMSACGRESGTEGGAGGSAPPAVQGEKKGTIGVAMPTKTSQRWIKDGDAIKKELENIMCARPSAPTTATSTS